MILTKNNFSFTQSLVKGNLLLQNALIKASFVLYNNGTGGSCFGSGTVLFAMPNDADGAANVTYLVTSKESLQLYNIDAAVAGGKAIPSRPAFSTGSSTSTFNTLITDFKANTQIIYNQQVKSAPVLPPTINHAAVNEVVFFDGDNGWDYDVILLKSTDQGLYDYVTKDNYSAWGDVSGWVDLSDMPNSTTIKKYFSESKNILLTGFGNTLAPQNYNTIAPPTVQKVPTVKLTFIPPATTQPPPDLPLPGSPPAVFPANSIQIMNCSATNKLIGPSISFWPTAVPGPDLVMTKDFSAARTCTEGSLLNALGCSCLSSDTGGSVYAPGTAGMSPDFLGVVSGINGTIESQVEWKSAWDKAPKEKNGEDLAKSMQPFLPWPPRNQVITLLTKMLNYWPLEWPPAPVGFYQATLIRQNQAKEFVKTKNSVATKTNITQALNVVFGSGGKATPSNYNTLNVLHASAGKKGTNASATIFYQQNADESNIISIQIIAIGAHSGDTSYTIDWVWDDYTSWYNDEETKKAAEIASIPAPNSQQGKAQKAAIVTKYQGIMGTQELKQGVIYTL